MRTVIVLTFVCLQLPAGAQPPEGRRFTLDQIVEGYDLFANQRDGVLKVAISVGSPS